MNSPLKGNVSVEFTSLVEQVSNIVHRISGNRLGEKQAYMIETRVKKRMMELNFKSAKEYSEFIEKNFDKESHVLVGLITTHHTFFFREFPHFEILKLKLPAIVKEVKKRNEKNVMIWSAACSRGHEVYSLAMFLNALLPEIDPTISFKIIGTDIDNESIKIAQNGVYHQNEIKEIPMHYLNNNWAKGSGEIAMYAKVKSQLKSKCEFKVGNLLKMSESVGLQKFDVIFCRNVFIYFESHQIESISKDILNRLYPHGLYFSGISEPLTSLKLELLPIGPSAYMHKPLNKPTGLGDTTATNIIPMPNKVDLSGSTSAAPILKVLCVDDSPSILTLLKKILSKEQGFEVVATASNGLEAIEKMKSGQFDLMTLDIHMPEMDGLTYLQKNHTNNHPPVVIISSASRADADTAMRAFKYGASDYVEKPALTNLDERGDEIRTKLRSLAGIKTKKVNVSSFDQENAAIFKISNPENKMRFISGSFSDLAVIKKMLNDLDHSQPPTILFFEGMGEVLETMANEHQRDFKKNVVFFNDTQQVLEANTIYFADFKKCLQPLVSKNKDKPFSVMIFGELSTFSNKVMKESLIVMKTKEVLIEDRNEKYNSQHPLKAMATDIVPATSFMYMSCRFLSKN
jgi:chemotaxis protein methyltransferase CheR